MIPTWNGLETFSGSHQWVLALLDLSIKTTALLLVGFLLGRVLRRASARMRHVLWVSILIGSLALPVLTLVVPSWHVASIPFLNRSVEIETVAVRIDEPLPDPSGNTGTPLVEELEPTTSGAREAVTPGRGLQAAAALAEIHWPVWALGVWLAGAVLVVSALLVGLARTRRLAARSLSLERGSWLPAIAESSELVGLTKPVQLRMADVAAPATWGWFHPVVVMPRDADTWPDGRKRVVLLHELTHIKRNDWLVHTAVRFLCAVYWFHPLVWMASKRLCIEREKACDDNVIRLGTKPSEYARHLFEIARSMSFRTPALSAALTMARPTQLEGRLMSILQNTNRGGGRKIWLVPALVGLLTIPVAAITSGKTAKPEYNVMILAPIDKPIPPVAPNIPGQSLRPLAALPAPPAPSSKAGSPGFRGVWIHNEDDDGDRTYYRIGYVDGDFVFEEHLRDIGLHIRVDGNVEFSDKGDEIVRMDPGAVVVIEAEKSRRDVRLEISSGRGGDLEYKWEVDGKAQPFDDDARAWTRTAVSILSRRIDMGLLSGERNALRGEINSIYGERNSLRGEINALYGDRNALLGEINSIYGDRNAMQGEINALRGEQHSTEGDIRSLQGEQNVLRGEINAIRGEANMLEGELNMLQGRKQKLERERRRLESRASARDKNSKEYQSELEQIDVDLRDVMEDIDNTSEQIEALRVDRVNDIESRIQELKEETQARRVQQEHENQEMEERIRQMQADMNTMLEHRLQDAHERMAELKVDEMVQTLKDRIADMKIDQRVEGLETQIEQLNFDERMESFEKALDQLYKDLEKMTKKIIG